jgi:putative transposase
MESFRLMCNDAIRIGIETNSSSLKCLSNLSYGSLKEYDVPSHYKLCAISKAAGILAARKKSIRRGFPTKRPYLSKQVLLSCYGIRIKDGNLLIPLGDHRFEAIHLNARTLGVVAQPGLIVRSFTLTDHSLSICIAREVEEMKVEGRMVGIDRNLRSVTVGNEDKVTYYDVSRVVEIGETTRSIIRSLKRNDARIRKKIAGKYGSRRQERIRQILHRISKRIVEEARSNRQGITFEEIRGIRKLYRKGNGQGRNFRGRMNSWPFAELKRQIEYKAAWEGLPVITLTRNETKGTTMDCHRCGERLQDSRNRPRQLWCSKCERWEDRDLVAVMNISRRGWLRFDQSQKEGGKGEASEAVKGNGMQTPLILRVDASKLDLHQTKT